MAKINKNNLEEKLSTKLIRGFVKAFNAVYEISARAESSFLEVFPIYLWTSYKFYSKYKKEKKSPENYNLILDEKAFRLTERIIEENKIKRVDKYEKLEKLKKIKELEEYGKN